MVTGYIDASALVTEAPLDDTEDATAAALPPLLPVTHDIVEPPDAVDVQEEAWQPLVVIEYVM